MADNELTHGIASLNIAGPEPSQTVLDHLNDLQQSLQKMPAHIIEFR